MSDENCPACGAAVADKDGERVCTDCELVLGPAGGGDAASAEDLSAAILERMDHGMPLRDAVADACRALFAGKVMPALAAPRLEEPAPEAEDAPEEASAAPAAPPTPGACPLCGAEGWREGSDCAGCGLEPAELEELLETVDRTARYVCHDCHQPYAKAIGAACPDCGGMFLSADRLKAYAEVA